MDNPFFVTKERLELSRLSTPDPKSGVAAITPLGLKHFAFLRVRYDTFSFCDPGRTRTDTDLSVRGILSPLRTTNFATEP